MGYSRGLRIELCTQAQERKTQIFLKQSRWVASNDARVVPKPLLSLKWFLYLTVRDYDIFSQKAVRTQKMGK